MCLCVRGSRFSNPNNKGGRFRFGVNDINQSIWNMLIPKLKLMPSPQNEERKKTTYNKKWIGNTPNVLDTCKPLQAIVPKCFATAFALLYVFRSKWLNELSNMCACVYIRCVLYTNKKIIDKNFSSIEIYWLCMNKLNPKAWWGRTFITTQLNKLFTIFI